MSCSKRMPSFHCSDGNSKKLKPQPFLEDADKSELTQGYTPDSAFFTRSYATRVAPVSNNSYSIISSDTQLLGLEQNTEKNYVSLTSKHRHSERPCDERDRLQRWFTYQGPLWATGNLQRQRNPEGSLLYASETAYLC